MSRRALFRICLGASSFPMLVQSAPPLRWRAELGPVFGAEARDPLSKRRSGHGGLAIFGHGGLLAWMRVRQSFNSRREVQTIDWARDGPVDH